MNRYRVRWLVMLAWGMFALILTTQSDRVPLVRLVSRTIGSTELGATIGHAALFGMLTLLLYLALAMRFRLTLALFGAMAVTLMIGASTEIFQRLVVSRTSSTADLLANWLGVFAVGFMIAYAHAARRRAAYNPL